MNRTSSLLFLLAACGHDKADQADTPPADSAVTDPIDVPVDRSILQFSGDGPATANTAQLPAGFATPEETVCAADTSRQYLGEIVTDGIDDIQVDWHWAPVVPGPDLTHPTLSQPEWWYAGTITGGNDSGDDVLADHPFGLDYSFDVTPDAAFAYMPFAGEEEGEGLHCEIEQNTFPRDGLGYTAVNTGRALLRGVWVLDCGHPPFGAEMHPPSFLAFAHEEDATSTSAMTFVEPYRSSLMFNPDTDLAVDFADDARFSDRASLSFPHAFIAAILSSLSGDVEQLASPALMVANRFEPVDFLVCAPLPRPDGASMDAQWNFAARTGVSLTVTPLPDDGCARVQATMTDAYTPLPLPYAAEDWSWEQLSASAGDQLGEPLDVRLAIIDALATLGIDASAVPALQAENPPLVDAYAALLPLTGADDLSGQVVLSGADAQPYPFYGRIAVSWR